MINQILIENSKLKYLLITFIFIYSTGKLYSVEIREDSTRKYWITILTKIADPVLTSLSREQLKQNMPVEVSPAGKTSERQEVTHLEAFGRLMAGLAPWLELGPGDDEEGKQRQKYIGLSLECLKNAVNPESSDFMNFNQKSRQPLVDAAFLAHALIRAPKILWGGLDKKSQLLIIDALKSTRIIKAYENNWLLFSAMIETALLNFTGEWDSTKVQYALKKHMEWYKGDGIYGDGPEFHWDYYNSFVIQPMMIDILKICKKKNIPPGGDLEICLKRAKRYAEIQERLISPEGTFPVIGRSMAYRVGVFQHIGQIALMHELPESVKPEQVRCALTAVINRVMKAPDTFNKYGWLQLGFCGHQPDIAEGYISTGSLYLCATGFLPLGLPAEDDFWKNPDMEWTQKRIWSGKNIKADHAIGK